MTTPRSSALSETRRAQLEALAKELAFQIEDYVTGDESEEAGSWGPAGVQRIILDALLRAEASPSASGLAAVRGAGVGDAQAGVGAAGVGREGREDSLTTRWKCTNCGADGAIRHKADESVWTVIDKLKASHRRETDADCDIARMRVTLVEPADRRKG